MQRVISCNISLWWHLSVYYSHLVDMWSRCSVFRLMTFMCKIQHWCVKMNINFPKWEERNKSQAFFVKINHHFSFCFQCGNCRRSGFWLREALSLQWGQTQAINPGQPLRPGDTGHRQCPGTTPSLWMFVLLWTYRSEIPLPVSRHVLVIYRQPKQLDWKHNHVRA